MKKIKSLIPLIIVLMAIVAIGCMGCSAVKSTYCYDGKQPFPKHKFRN